MASARPAQNHPRARLLASIPRLVTRFAGRNAVPEKINRNLTSERLASLRREKPEGVCPRLRVQVPAICECLSGTKSQQAMLCSGAPGDVVFRGARRCSPHTATRARVTTVRALGSHLQDQLAVPWPGGRPPEGPPPRSPRQRGRLKIRLALCPEPMAQAQLVVLPRWMPEHPISTQGRGALNQRRTQLSGKCPRTTNVALRI